MEPNAAAASAPTTVSPNEPPVTAAAAPKKKHSWTAAQQNALLQELKRADKALRPPDLERLVPILGVWCLGCC